MIKRETTRRNKRIYEINKKEKEGIRKRTKEKVENEESKQINSKWKSLLVK
jgi:hypothetical protein